MCETHIRVYLYRRVANGGPMSALACVCVCIEGHQTRRHAQYLCKILPADATSLKFVLLACAHCRQFNGSMKGCTACLVAKQ